VTRRDSISLFSSTAARLSTSVRRQTTTSSMRCS
jgi:hypothetical protein